MPLPVRIYQYGDPNIAGGIMDRQLGRIELQLVPPNTNVAGGVLPITPEGYFSAMAGLTSQEWVQMQAVYMAGVGQTNSSGNCSAWSDLSGRGRNLIQGTATNQPAIQSDGSLVFDGVDNYMQTAAFALSQPFTIYMAATQLTHTPLDTLYDRLSGGPAVFCALYQTASSNTVEMFCTAGGPTSGTDWPLVTQAVVTAVFNGASSSLTINSGAPATGNPGATGLDGFTLGARNDLANFGHVQVWEVIIRAGADSADLRGRIQKYLMSKYAI